jgi:hypothetical protein
MIATLLIGAMGCASSSNEMNAVERDQQSRTLTTMFAPPFFFHPDFSSRFNSEEGYQTDTIIEEYINDQKVAEFKGTLSVLGNNLAFEFQAKGKGLSETKSIWNTSTQTGFLSSEAIQGIAPLNSSNIGPPTPTERIKVGQEMIKDSLHHVYTASVTRLGESSLTHRVWVVANNPGLPTKVDFQWSTHRKVATFGKAKPTQFTAANFEKPEGLSSYPSPQTMLSALLRRQAGLNPAVRYQELGPMRRPDYNRLQTY